MVILALEDNYLAEEEQKLRRNYDNSDPINVCFVLKQLKCALHFVLVRAVNIYGLCFLIIPTFQWLHDERGSSCLMLYKHFQMLPKYLQLKMPLQLLNEQKDLIYLLIC